MKKLFRRAATVAIAGAMLAQAVVPAYGYSFSITGNGADSYNKIKVRSSKKVRVRQSNSAFVSNWAYASANTGKNDANDNTGGNVTITTGDASASASVVNTFNSNVATIDLCCDGDKPCDPQDPCHNETIWAHHVPESQQGTLKDGSAITDPERTDANDAIGTPDGNFFSIGKDGWIVVHFLSPVDDVSGNDLSFHEITNDRDTYPEEKAHVQVSFDGITYQDVGDITNKDTDGISYLDFSGTGLPQIHYVRITDTTDYDLHEDDADGYDLDAVDGMHKVCPDPV